jgi:hypothetical protein
MSYEVRFSPSRGFHSLISRRPITSTRWPLGEPLDVISLRPHRPHAEPVCALDVSPSGPRRRELTATRILAWATPSAFYRYSGSDPRFPMISIRNMTKLLAFEGLHYTRMTEANERA